MADGTLTLQDERTLGYKIYGPEDAKPVLYFHGTPSSRLEPLLLYEYGIDVEQLLAEAGLKLIAVDRPGKGLSSFDEKASFLSFADNVRELCANLHINNCPVLCWSGGGPYALAIAYKHPQLIHSVHIICGFTRRFASDVEQLMGMNKWYFIFAKRTPWLLRSAMETTGESYNATMDNRFALRRLQIDE
jgi:pimeloyl-ACP methyl ester carboxylesterase